MEANVSNCMSIDTVANNTFELSHFQKILILTAFCSVGILGMLGNVAVIVAFVTNSEIRKLPINLYTFSLAVTDVAYISATSCLYLILYIPEEPLSVSNDLQILMEILGGISLISYLASNSILIQMSHDRYMLVKDALSYSRRQTQKRVILVIVSTLATDICVSVLLLLVLSVVGDLFCGQIQFFQSTITQLTVAILIAVIFLGLPLTILIGFNLAVYWKLRQRSLLFHFRRSSTDSRSVTEIQRNGAAGHSCPLDEGSDGSGKDMKLFTLSRNPEGMVESFKTSRLLLAAHGRVIHPKMM